MSAVKSFIGFVGRALFSLLFLAGGLQSFLHWKDIEQLFTLKLHNWITVYLGHPELQDKLEWALAHVGAVLLFTIVLQLLGGLMLFLGLGVRIGAFLLLIYLVPPTFLDHYSWLMDSSHTGIQMLPFLQKISLIGALIFFTAYGKGGKGRKPPKVQPPVSEPK